MCKFYAREGLIGFRAVLTTTPLLKAVTQAVGCNPSDWLAPTLTDVVLRFVNRSDAVGMIYWRAVNNDLQEYHL